MPRLRASFDWATLLAALLLAVAGIITIFGATEGIPEQTRVFQMQVIWLMIGLAAFLIAATIDYHVWSDIAPVLYGASLVLLGLVLVLAPRIAGSRAWFVLGPLRFQPSEAAKVGAVLMVAWYLAQRGGTKLGFGGLAALGMIVGLPIALIALQPDYGTCLTYVPLFAVAVFAGGLRLKTLIILILIAALLAPLVWVYGLKGYQKERILTVFQPERDPTGTGYQVRQSRIAVGSGGLWGKGLRAGTQSRLQFLPQQHTDFVFAALAEQRGFVGSAAVLGLYVFLVLRAFGTARMARDRLGLYLALGIGTLLGCQVLINIGMVLGALPTIGVPLPLFSYGGSSILATMAALGLMVNIRSRRFVN